MYSADLSLVVEFYYCVFCDWLNNVIFLTVFICMKHVTSALRMCMMALLADSFNGNNK